MKIAGILAKAFLAALPAICGCQKTTTVDASAGAPREVSNAPELVAQSRPPIPDVPVPLGFELQEDKSRDFAAAGARYVDHVYKGGDDRFAVARFYKRQMPIARWTLVSSVFAQGEVTLDFDKETERCRISISRSGLFPKTYINVLLYTTGKIETAGTNR